MTRRGISPVVYGRRPSPTPDPARLEEIHLKRHVARGRIVGKCQLCRAARPPERRIALSPKDVLALEQFVERVERLTAFVRELLGR